MLAVHGVRQNPPGPDRHFVTYNIRAGYALPDEARLRQRMTSGNSSSRVVEIDISLNDSICDDQWVEINPQLKLRIATLEDIVAEKLRALL